MSMKYIRDTYKVPAKRGMKVIADGEPGKIVGSHGAYLRIKLDFKKKPLPFHPTWHMEYLTKEGAKTFMGGREYIK